MRLSFALSPLCPFFSFLQLLEEQQQHGNGNGPTAMGFHQRARADGALDRHIPPWTADQFSLQQPTEGKPLFSLGHSLPERIQKTRKKETTKENTKHTARLRGLHKEGGATRTNGFFFFCRQERSLRASAERTSAETRSRSSVHQTNVPGDGQDGENKRDAHFTLGVLIMPQ